MIDQIETAQAERLSKLVALAQYRGGAPTVIR